MTMDLAQAENIAEMIEKKGLITAVGFQDRYLDLMEIVGHAEVSRAATKGQGSVVQLMRSRSAEDEFELAIGVPMEHDRKLSVYNVPFDS